MTVSRRTILRIGGGFLAGFAMPRAVSAEEAVVIAMQGDQSGSNVRFDPVGLHVRPGRTIRWTNFDPGNSHTATAYHPKFFDRPLRMPKGADPWNSDYLLPNESFSVTLTVEGVYDFYCIPHEHAGMVGRIVVGDPAGMSAQGLPTEAIDGEPIPDIALQAFPTIEEIMARGTVRRSWG